VSGVNLLGGMHAQGRCESLLSKRAIIGNLRNAFEGRGFAYCTSECMNGQVAQKTAANMAQFPNATTIGNPSDNILLSAFVDPALGCQTWMVPDLANNNTPAPALPLNEIQAAKSQQAPIALVPATDPMVVNNGNPDLMKVNAYRAGVDQPAAATLADANGNTYCYNYLNTGLPHIQEIMVLRRILPHRLRLLPIISSHFWPIVLCSPITFSIAQICSVYRIRLLYRRRMGS
jgi:hypothetical protein